MKEGRLFWRDRPSVVKASGFVHAPVFDPATGETHFLAELPALILAELDSTARSVPELIERLAGSEGLDEEAQKQILEALTQLEAAELVESGPPPTD